MKTDYKHIESDNIKKIYNKEFDIFVYKLGKKTNILIVDKRSSSHPIIYNSIEIASHYIL